METKKGLMDYTTKGAEFVLKGVVLRNLVSILLLKSWYPEECSIRCSKLYNRAKLKVHK